MRFFQVPCSRFKTKEDVIKAFGYTLSKKLDEGGFGTVFIAEDHRKKIKVACKWMDLGSVSSNSDDTRLADTKNELMVLEQVRHPYVIKVLCNFVVQQDNTNNMYIFMELADGGNLYKYFEKRGVPGEVECAKYFAQVVCGIGHMHGLAIAHRDIKMQNILLVANNRSITGDYLLRVSDFGLSKQVKVIKRIVEMSSTNCGTLLYMAPELIQKKSYDAYLVDVWALGITLFEMLSLELPFNFDKSEDEVLKQMLDNKWKWSTKMKDRTASSALTELMKSMLNPDPAKRIRLIKVMIHDWVKVDYQAAHALSDQIKAEEYLISNNQSSYSQNSNNNN